MKIKLKTSKIESSLKVTTPISGQISNSTSQPLSVDVSPTKNRERVINRDGSLKSSEFSKISNKNSPSSIKIIDLRKPNVR